MPNAYNRYSKEEWDIILKGVLPDVSSTGMDHHSPVGLSITMRILCGMNAEQYEQYWWKFLERRGEEPELFESLKYIREGQVDENGMPLKTYVDKVTLDLALPFVLEMPFNELPLYVSTPNEKVRKLVNARIMVGK